VRLAVSFDVRGAFSVEVFCADAKSGINPTAAIMKVERS